MASGAVIAEFVAIGRPVSLQARRRDRVREWRVAVRTASLGGAVASSPVVTEAVAVEIAYYLDEVGLDVDNIAKPVLDALKGGLLADDKQVGELLVCKRRSASAARMALPSPPASWCISW